MTITELFEQQIQETCPDFCEQTEHDNMHTAESPCIGHTTQDRDVHGVLISIGTATDGERVELDDSARAICINQEKKSLQEARDIGHAILMAFSDAEVANPYVRACLEESGPSTSVRAAQMIRQENQAKHDRLRAARATS